MPEGRTMTGSITMDLVLGAALLGAMALAGGPVFV